MKRSNSPRTLFDTSQRRLSSISFDEKERGGGCLDSCYANNPDKLKDLQLHGIKVAERIPVVMPPNQFNKFYLETKRKKLGHILDIEQRDDLAYPHSLD